MASPSYKYINKLKSKRVLIFGATSGIGYAVAEAALEYGADIIITGSNAERLANTIRKLEASYPDAAGRIDSFPSDLSSAATLEPNLTALLDHATRANKIDHVSFSAGDAFVLTPLDATAPAALAKLQTVRLVAPLVLAKLLPRYIAVGPASSLTLTSGVGVHRPPKGWSLGSAVGGALSSVVRGLAVDLAPVRVNIVELGLVDTPLTQKIIASKGRNALLAGTLTGAIGRAEDVAEAYLYFMRDANVAGTSIATDSGKLLA